MPVSKITTKGQVTIPTQIRKALNLEQGDTLIFEVVKEDEARLRVVRRQRLTELRGALPATRPYPGKNEIRVEAAQVLAKDTEAGQS